MKLTTRSLRSIIKEEISLLEGMAADEDKLKRAVIDALVALYFRHEFAPKDVAVDLAAEAQAQIDKINTNTGLRR